MVWCLCLMKVLYATQEQRKLKKRKTRYWRLPLRKVLCGICLSGATLCLTVSQLLLDNQNKDQDFSIQKIIQHLIKTGPLRWIYVRMYSAFNILDQF